MLKYISTIWEYREFTSSQKSNLDKSDHNRLNTITYKRAIHKLNKLDVYLAIDH